MHRPSRPPTSHASHCPLHTWSQQKPSTQIPPSQLDPVSHGEPSGALPVQRPPTQFLLKQSSGPVHPSPSLPRGTHSLLSHWCVSMQSSLVRQSMGHSLCLPSQSKRPHAGEPRLPPGLGS